MVQKREKSAVCEFTIDFQSEEAIYLQLRNQVIMAIAMSKLQDGETLPSVRQMADVLGVNMHTVNKAYHLLREDGYLKLDRRKGAVIQVEVSSDKKIEVESLHQNIQVMVAEAICKEISKEEFQMVIENMYRIFDNQEEVSIISIDL